MIIQLTFRNKQPALINTKFVIVMYPSDNETVIIMKGEKTYFVIERIDLIKNKLQK